MDDSTPLGHQLDRAGRLAIHLRRAGAREPEIEQTLWATGIHPSIAAAVTRSEVHAQMSGSRD